MIEPTHADIGRAVIYQAQHTRAPRERGIITSFNEHAVFVRFGRDGVTSAACFRRDLRWPEDTEKRDEDGSF